MTNDAETRSRWSIAPYFFVRDVAASANWYRDHLGFSYERFWGDPPRFCMVRRSGIIIMLSQLDSGDGVRPNRMADPDEGAWDAYIWVEDADALSREFASTGVHLVREPCDQMYGCRDFEVDDLDGYRLCFGMDLNA